MTDLKILLLSEGDAETKDSWSGSANSLVETLRSMGHEVRCGNVALSGPERWLAAAATFSPDRRRWWVRYHLGSIPFRLRSRQAGRLIRRRGGGVDLVLQIGGTFEPRGIGQTPYVLYCDSNIALAEAGRKTGLSDAARLRDDELERVREREARVYERASTIFTMSRRLEQSFVEDFRLPNEKIQTVHAGPNFDIDRIPYPPPERGDRPPTVLFVGRQFERKGGGLLLDAFQRVRREVPEARLLIVGPDDLEVLRPGVEVLGFLDKDTEDGWESLKQAYAGADVLCLPTRFEPFGIVYLEAMCFGLPCVGPDAWAVPEMVVDGETGFTFPPGDEEELAARLVKLLSHPGKAREMGRKGRRRATDRFTWTATVERMLPCLDAIRQRGES